MVDVRMEMLKIYEIVGGDNTLSSMYVDSSLPGGLVLGCSLDLWRFGGATVGNFDAADTSEEGNGTI